MRAGKLDSAFVDLNADSRTLVRDELRGRPVPVDGRPVLEAEPVRMPDGCYGMFLDQTPMQGVMTRWQEANFEALEREFAQIWRNRLASVPTAGRRVVRLRRKTRRAGKAVTESLNDPKRSFG